ncbi:MAG: hypothetical protein P4M11_04680 [Candidatus Pacebacteria bacterium]|nr:hypothetical protein [Candidatus Paceibacterota bacterium]
MYRISEKKAKLFFKQKWLLKFPEKRKRLSLEEIYAKDYWVAYYVWNVFKHKLAKKREREARRMDLSPAPVKKRFLPLRQLKRKATKKM